MADRDMATVPSGEAARRVLPLIDLTSLGDDDTPADIDRLCDAAETPYGSVAAVCIWPRFVAQAVGKLAGTAIPVAAVANFPLGEPDPALAVADAEAIIAAGGNEVDVVLPWRALRAGDASAAVGLVADTKAAVGERAVLKVILETGELNDAALIRTAATIALDNGADFLKTSTGKTARSADPKAARLLLEVLAETGSSAGIKISGGVRTVDQAGQYLAIADEVMGPDWVSQTTFRFGASALLDNVLADLQLETQNQEARD